MERPSVRPIDASDRQQTPARAIDVAACCLVIIVTILRYSGRWVLRRRTVAGRGIVDKVYGLDDVFNVLSVISFFVLAIAVFIAIDRGMGVHYDTVFYEKGIEGWISYNQAIFVAAIFYNTTLGMIKLSVLALYMRILRGVPSQKLRVLVWSVFGIVAANTTANVLVAIFQCWPVKAAWDVSMAAADKRCVDINAFYLGNAITGVITDATVYLLSIPIVKPLQLDTKTKIQLLATMLIGGFAVVTSAVRLGFIPALLKDPDFTMAMALPMNWSIAEPAVGILVSSMPAIRALRFLWRKANDSTYGSAVAHSTHKSRNGGHIQLHDINTDVHRDNNSDMESGKERSDGDSEENLVRAGHGKQNFNQISRTTELEVSYSSQES